MTATPADSASRVHQLSVPTSVTFVATLKSEAFGDRQHYSVTGYDHAGCVVFDGEVVPADGEDLPLRLFRGDSAVGAIEVVLGRLRERGW